MSDTKTSLSSQVLSYFLGRTGALVITFLAPVVLVRIFSKTDYGQYNQLLFINAFLFRTLQFGIPLSLFYFLPRYKADKAYYITNSYVQLLFLGLLDLLALTLFREEIAGLFNAPKLSSLMPLCGLQTLFMMVACPFAPALIVESKAEHASLVEFFSQVIRSVFVIAFALASGTVFGAAIGLVCYSLVMFLAYSYFAFRHYGLALDKNNLMHMKRQLRYSAPLGFSGLLETGSLMVDNFILSILFTPEIFAIYAVGKLRVPLASNFFTVVGEVILPRAVEMLKENRIGQFLDLWKKLLIRLSFIGVGVFFAGQVIARDIITLAFTEDYAASVPIFRIILLLTFREMLLYGIVLRTTGHTSDILKSNVGSIAICIPITFILVRHFGPIGAAAASVLALYLISIGQLYYAVVRLKVKVTELLPVMECLKLGLIGALVSGVLVVTQDFIPLKALRIIISSLAFLAAYTYISYKMGIYNLLQEDAVMRVLKKLGVARRG